MVTVRVIWFWNAIKSFVLAFFVAGAVIFPLTEPYYIPREGTGVRVDFFTKKKRRRRELS